MPKFFQCHRQRRAPWKRSVPSVNDHRTIVDIFRKFYGNGPCIQTIPFRVWLYDYIYIYIYIYKRIIISWYWFWVDIELTNIILATFSRIARFGDFCGFGGRLELDITDLAVTEPALLLESKLPGDFDDEAWPRYYQSAKDFFLIYISKPIKRSYMKLLTISINLRPASLLKKRLWQRCFPMNFVKYSRAPFW